MADQAATFFKELGQKRHMRLLEGTSGTILLELAEGKKVDKWYVDIKRGDVTVSRKGGDADCVIKTDKDTFHAIIAGQTNAVAAVLRGVVELQGKVSLLVGLQSLFMPSGGAADQPVAGYAGRPS